MKFKRLKSNLLIPDTALPANPTSGQKQWTEYFRNHSACPKCGGVDIEQTTMGVSPPDRSNRAWCSECEWQGYVDDLVPAREESSVGGKLVKGAKSD